MNTPELRHFLLWCIGINYLVIAVWFVAFVSAHDWLFRLHSRWFRLTVESFDAIHYLGMAMYKVGVLLVFVAPLVALYMTQ